MAYHPCEDPWLRFGGFYGGLVITVAHLVCTQKVGFRLTYPPPHMGWYRDIVKGKPPPTILKIRGENPNWSTTRA